MSEKFKEWAESGRLRKINLGICKENDLVMVEVTDSHIEIYDKSNKLLNVLYGQKSLNFYLNSVAHKKKTL